MAENTAAAQQVEIGMRRDLFPSLIRQERGGWRFDAAWIGRGVILFH